MGNALEFVFWVMILTVAAALAVSGLVIVYLICTIFHDLAIWLIARCSAEAGLDDAEAPWTRN